MADLHVTCSSVLLWLRCLRVHSSLLVLLRRSISQSVQLLSRVGGGFRRFELGGASCQSVHLLHGQRRRRRRLCILLSLRSWHRDDLVHAGEVKAQRHASTRVRCSTIVTTSGDHVRPTHA